MTRDHTSISANDTETAEGVSHKAGYPVERILGELSLCAGTPFDPQIAAAAFPWRDTPLKGRILSGQPVERETRVSIAG